MTCEQLLKSASINSAKSYIIPDIPPLEISKRVYKVDSVESLAKFLEEISGKKSADYSKVQDLAQLIFNEYGSIRVKEIVLNLLMSHRHLAQEAVLEAIRQQSLEEFLNVRSLVDSFPKPIDVNTLNRWTKLEKGISENTNFTLGLDRALIDYKNFDSVYKDMINVDRSFDDMVEALKTLNNPTLVGQFIEFFLQADSLTKQYIIENVTELKPLSSRVVSVVLKGQYQSNLYLTSKTLEGILRITLDELQEKAYFVYRSNGAFRRPQLNDIETSKTVAIRFINRMNYDLTDYNVSYASQFLAKYPKYDKEVDQTLQKLLDAINMIEEKRYKNDVIQFSTYELLLLVRSSTDHSEIKIDLRHTKYALSHKTNALGYLKSLIDFHMEFDLRNFPDLKNIVIEYFLKNPDSLSELEKWSIEGLPKFRQDFSL